MNVWISENRFCIVQEKVEDKSNEITATPLVLNDIDIEDTVVSIDVMGTQREITEFIVEKKGHYLLALKTNQKSLFEDVECAFKMNGGHDMYQTIDADHGRIETRKCSILLAAEYLMEENLQAWKNLGTIIRLEARREIQGKITQETRYYISDEKENSAIYFCLLVREHWIIENQLHWHLDITFKEDACRARVGYASQNLSVLRKMALHIISEQKDRLSIKKRPYKAALDKNYLKNLLKI